MTIELQVQNASSVTEIPSLEDFNRWAGAVLQSHDDTVLTIRLVDDEESRALNATYRHKDSPTNVLSFPADLPEEIDLPLLGDIVICAPLVEREAAEQGKSRRAHWAHLTLHGILHLLGHDHRDDREALEMESIETRAMQALGFPDPYS
jgi:probable rRNA maturation factor